MPPKRRGGPSDRYSGKRPHYPSYRKARRPHWFKRAFKLAAFWIGLPVLIILVGLYSTLPDINTLNKFTKAPSILIKSQDGRIVGSFGDIYGDYVPFKELPVSLIDAVIATEDRNFYRHFGIDPFGLLRATFANIRARHVVQGGSTITQQVAKNVFLTPERSLLRKVREMMLAVKLENRFSKQDIMSIYLNRVYFGAGNYGVDAAAHRYFDKSARSLTLSESAIMAGLLKAPSRFAPTSNPALSRKRAETVLVNMQEAGFLNERQTNRAKEDLVRSMNARKRTAQSTFYFADWILDQLPDYIGNLEEDIVVTTTLKPEWQLMAEKAIKDVMDKDGDAHKASQAALLSMTPDGAVRALIGGRNYAESQYNRATQALRQPGSSFKLFVYLAGLEAGFAPSSLIEDQPVSIRVSGGWWSPKNYNGRYLGTITMKEAVTDSINTVAVQVAQSVGFDRVVSMAHRLGISNDIDPLPSIALGSTEVSLLELTTAYAHLAAGGDSVEPYGIIEIENTKGDLLYQRETPRGGVALRAGIVGEMNEMLMSVVESGTGRAARIGRPVAGKTGTTSDYRDAWFMGYTPDLVTGVWVGNDDNAEMKKVTGGMLPARIWHDYMIAALANTPARSIPTGGGGFLPFGGGGAPREETSYPQQPGIEQREERREALPRARNPEENILLGPDFWNKLMR